jgi:mannose/cellobiose epimerase-like protein (N-acyl-D-glucosamine 2-epimerase family)
MSDRFSRALPDLRDHLLTRVLPFWAEHSIDVDHGGFITHLDRAGNVTDDSTKYLVMQTRMIYSFVTGHALGGPAAWLSAASQGLDFFLRHFRDMEHDGWFWSVTRTGAPVDTRKRTYGHAFAGYALSEYARLTRDRRALAAAVHTGSLALHHFWDPATEGAIESCARDWTPTDRSHSMGTHLHALEALLALNDAVGENRYWWHAKAAAGIIVAHMVDAEYHCGVEHFAADWTPEADPARALVNYGHNLEAAWLLLRVHRSEASEECRETARAFLDYVLQHGLDETHGGVYSHGPRGEAATVREKNWWVQCEALPAFLLGALVFQEERYLEAFRNVADFCLTRLHDPEFGEWYPVTAEDGTPRSMDKGGSWKAAYHVTQALAYGHQYLGELSLTG